MESHNMKEYKPRDEIWVKILLKDMEKLDPLGTAPCEIVKNLHGGRHTIQIELGHEDHYMDSLKPYTEQLTRKAIHFCITSQK